MKRLFLLFLLLTLSAGLLSASVRVDIRTQAEFDQAGTDLARLLQEAGDSLVLSFSPGTYYFKERHFSLSGMDNPQGHLVIEGNGAIFIAEGETLAPQGEGDGVSLSTPFSLKDGWVDMDQLQTMDFQGKIKKSQTFPIPVLYAPGLFKIRCHEADLPPEEATETYLIITQWFVGAVYKVEYIRNGFLYFRLKPRYRTKWFHELRFGRVLPRYLVYNHSRSQNRYISGGKLHSLEGGTIHRCLQSSFLAVDSSVIGSISMRGCRFLGNADGEEALLSFKQVASGAVEITDNVFEGVKSILLSITGSNHVHFRSNRVTRCYLKAVYSDTESVDTQVTDNVFLDCGRMFTNAPIVYCQGSGFLIAGNYFQDFAYSAIGAGTHFSDPSGLVTEGIIEKNEICFTPTLPEGEERRILVDSGAIYIWTQNKHLVIRDNYVHDIIGYHGNRGIFCDDGVVNVDIYGNLVLNIHRSYCIDVREELSVQRKRSSKIRRVNINNRVWDNTIGGRMRCYMRKQDPGSYLGETYVLPEDYNREEVVENWKRKQNERPHSDP